MARNEQMMRQWGCLVRLEKGLVSRKELAEEFECSPRTISRDIEALTPIFPIYEEKRGNDVFYGFRNGYRLPGVWFTPNELSVLYVAKEVLRNAAGEGSFAKVFEELIEKIALTHTSSTQRASQKLPQIYQSDFSRPDTQSDYTEELIQAAQKQQCVAIRYFSASRGEEAERIVEPFVIRLTIQGLHLIGYCHLRTEFRFFTINRIKSLRVLQQSFDPAMRRFDLERYIEESFGGLRSDPVQKIKFHIRYPTAHWAKDLFFHSTQKIEETDDGILLTFRSGGEDAIIRRAVGLGPDCELLEPPHLRSRIVALLEKIAERYKKI